VEIFRAGRPSGPIDRDMGNPKFLAICGSGEDGGEDMAKRKIGGGRSKSLMACSCEKKNQPTEKERGGMQVVGTIVRKYNAIRSNGTWEGIGGVGLMLGGTESSAIPRQAGLNWASGETVEGGENEKSVIRKAGIIEDLSHLAGEACQKEKTILGV